MIDVDILYINLDILVKKLDFYGIRGIVKEWIVNDQLNKKLYVDLENNKSTMQKIECSVPQGSIWEPLLNLIYVNDSVNCKLGNSRSFANDMSLYLSDCNLVKLFANANVEVNTLFNWFCANRLPLNPTKIK